MIFCILRRMRWHFVIWKKCKSHLHLYIELKLRLWSLQNCNRTSCLIVLLLWLALIASRYFPTVLRLAFVDPVHSRWLSRPGKFRVTCSSRARELSPSSTRRTSWIRVKSSSKFLRAREIIFFAVITLPFTVSRTDPRNLRKDGVIFVRTCVRRSTQITSGRIFGNIIYTHVLMQKCCRRVTF